MATWQLYNYLLTSIPAGKRVLRINLDETSICLFQGRVKGNVFVSKREPRIAQDQSASQQRTYFSHVGLICDDPMIQPSLPQFILGNERSIPAGQLPALRASCARNVWLDRGKSAWMNVPTMRRVLRQLKVALEPYMDERQPILLLDANTVHINAQVLADCRAAGILPVVVPAKLTWLLQPLDTHAFAQYKAHLRGAFLAARLRTADGNLSLEAFLGCVQEAIRTVLQGRRWDEAFDGNGFSVAQGAVSSRVTSQLDLTAPLAVPSTRPSFEQLRRLLPEGSRVPAALCPAVLRALPFGPRARWYGPAPAPLGAVRAALAPAHG